MAKKKVIPKTDIKNPVGAPPKYNNVTELEAKILEYFNYIQGSYSIETNEVTGKPEKIWERYAEPATISGLALFLGFESRQSIHDYKGKKEFSYTIKKARLKIESEYEKKLASQFPSGAIFALKNLGWQDKTVAEHEISGKDGKPIETKTTVTINVKRNRDDA